MILDDLAEATRNRIRKQKEAIPPEELRRRAESMKADTGFPFEAALARPGMSFICEVKKASPSKGLIAPDFPYLEIAKEYEKAGAAAISCLTETDYFLGSDRYLEDIASAVQIPVLRKDFTIDPYMIWRARVMGASAVLLICAILSEEQIREFREIAEGLGLSALVEAHDEQEVETAVRAGARMIGVNNRNLKDFTVDVRNSVRLRGMIPKDVIYVSESGIRTPEDVGALFRNGTDAVLIGETLMRSPDKKAELDFLRRDCVDR